MPRAIKVYIGNVSKLVLNINIYIPMGNYKPYTEYYLMGNGQGYYITWPTAHMPFKWLFNERFGWFLKSNECMCKL